PAFVLRTNWFQLKSGAPLLADRALLFCSSSAVVHASSQSTARLFAQRRTPSLRLRAPSRLGPVEACRCGAGLGKTNDLPSALSPLNPAPELSRTSALRLALF